MYIENTNIGSDSVKITIEQRSIYATYTNLNLLPSG